jgi:hypothetical protein
MSESAVIVGAIVFVASKQQHAAEEYERDREARCAKTFAFPEQEDACKHERDSSNDYLAARYKLFTWPEGITVWAIIATGFVIAWQSNETRKTAEASRRSIEMQEAEFVQWLDMGDWSVEQDTVATHAGTMAVQIIFPLVNNTTRPLFIQHVRTTLIIGTDRTHSVFRTEDAKKIPPKDEYRVVIDTAFNSRQVLSFVTCGILIESFVSVKLFNALNIATDADFQRLIHARGGEKTITVTKGHTSKQDNYTQHPN